MKATQTRKKKKPLPDKICQYCKEEFTPIRKNQLFCNAGCRWNDWDEKHPRMGVND